MSFKFSFLFSKRNYNLTLIAKHAWHDHGHEIRFKFLFAIVSIPFRYYFFLSVLFSLFRMYAVALLFRWYDSIAKVSYICTHIVQLSHFFSHFVICENSGSKFLQFKTMFVIFIFWVRWTVYLSSNGRFFYYIYNRMLTTFLYTNSHPHFSPKKIHNSFQNHFLPQKFPWWRR